jgi:hypothetical protein
MKAAARQQRRRPLTVDDWVRRVNALARRIDDYATGVHPGALEGDPYYQRLVQQYRGLAAAPTGDAMGEGHLVARPSHHAAATKPTVVVAQPLDDCWR